MEQIPSPFPRQLEFEKIRGPIRALKDGKDLAQFLGLTWPFLRYNLYKRSDLSKYREFKIKKRSGGERVILSPCTEIKRIQQVILQKVIYPIAPTKDCAHGFLRERSILTGASEHVRSRYVLNIDLKDFFPTINFGRVYGALKGKPYFLGNKVAAVIAHACCYRGSLPQGAPTSPMLSNMVCGRMDSQLARFAHSKGVVYTRYADDLTFSTRRSSFPGGFVVMTPPLPANATTAGTPLEGVIASNGFTVNEAKTRLKDRTQRLEVTGLVVNKKVNVNRSYVRNLRGAIHALATYGDDAEKIFQSSHNRTGSLSLKATIAGRLDFLRQVRGPVDPLYLNLANKAYELDSKFFSVPDRADLARFVRDRTWVVEDDKSQGTAFMLDGFGLVTCAHVVNENLKAYRAHLPDEKYDASIVDKDDARDLAILRIDFKGEAFEANLTNSPKLHQHVFVCGFPNYSGGTVNCSPGSITSFRKMFGTERFVVSQSIIKGNSGGPVLDGKWRVVGVAVTGAESSAKPNNDIDSTCIRISEFVRIRPKA